MAKQICLILIIPLVLATLSVRTPERISRSSGSQRAKAKPSPSPSPTATPTPSPTPTPTPAPSEVRIYQANLQHGMSTNGGFNYSGQVMQLTSGADIVVAQEVSVGDIPNWDSEFLSQGFSRVIFYEHLSGGDGNAIWIRSSLLTPEATYSFNLTNGPNPTSGSTTYGWDGSTDIRRGIVAARLKIAEKFFYLVNVHFCHSACKDSSTISTSSQRATQIESLKSWISTNLTGGYSIIVAGDMNFAPNTPRAPEGYQIDLFTQSGFIDLWQEGLTTGKAKAEWGDRDGDGLPDMPLGSLTTRTGDKRRLDYFMLKPGTSDPQLVEISVPDGRAPCPHALVAGGAFPSCAPEVIQQWDIPEDEGIRLSDHNWVLLKLAIN